MADNKIEKAIYGPSAIEVALGAILGFLLGVVVACVYLTFKPVKTVAELPKDEDRVAGMVYYQTGTMDSSRSRQWSAKQKRFLAGGGVTVSEDDLNAWVAAEFKKPAAGQGDAAAAPARQFLSAQPPNFRIVDGVLQIGYACRIDYFGVGATVQVQARGKFQQSGNTVEFDPDEFYIGSCPLHKLVGLGLPLMNKLSSLHPVSEEMKNAWAKVSDATLEGRTLKLTIP